METLGPAEVYECKNDPAWLDQEDVNELADIRDAVTAAGRSVKCGLVALSSERAIRAHLDGLSVPGVFYWASEEEIIDLGDMPIRRTR